MKFDVKQFCRDLNCKHLQIYNTNIIKFDECDLAFDEKFEWHMEIQNTIPKKCINFKYLQEEKIWMILNS